MKSKSLKTLKRQQPEPAGKTAKKVTSKQKCQTREGSLALLCKVSMCPGGAEHPGVIGQRFSHGTHLSRKAAVRLKFLVEMSHWQRLQLH